MAKKVINLGTAPTGRDGDSNRSAFNKSQSNFDETYTALGADVDGVLPPALPYTNGGTGATTLAQAKQNLGIDKINNTSDLNKPVSTATQTAINVARGLSGDAIAALETQTNLNLTELSQSINLALSGKEPTLAAGTADQFYRGDKTWQTLDKSAVGLGNVNNTTDAMKPISTATQLALNDKANKNDITAIAKGGTGATTAEDARTNLGALGVNENAVTATRKKHSGTIYATNGSHGWFKLGRVLLPMNGVSVQIKLIGGAGFDPVAPLQVTESCVTLRSSNSSGINVVLDYIAGSTAPSNVAYVSEGNRYFSLYLYAGAYSRYGYEVTLEETTDFIQELAYIGTAQPVGALLGYTYPRLRVAPSDLGTAAAATLTTTKTDSTTGRALKVGDFGVGSPISAINYVDFISSSKQARTCFIASDSSFGMGGTSTTGLDTCVFLGFPQSGTSGAFIGLTQKNGAAYNIHAFKTDRNTTVDSNGFIKNASPIVSLYADHIKLNEEAEQQPITFEKLGTGDYLIKGSSGFAQESWYIEQPKDANGNVYHAVIYDTLENGDIAIKTYERMLESMNVVADLTKPVDIKEGRFISIRLHEEPQEPIIPEIDPEILDNEGNAAPSQYHELEDGTWTISDEYLALLEQQRLEAMQPLKRRQFRLTLAMNGYDLKQVEALIEGIGDPMQRTIALIEWQDATDFERTNPTLLKMAELMQLTTAQVDQLWAFGLSL